jgi:hypothetical protein
LFTRCGPPTLEPFDFLARLALHAQLSQADIRRLPLKYPVRHLLNRLIKFAPGLYKWTKKSGAAAGQNLSQNIFWIVSLLIAPTKIYDYMK